MERRRSFREQRLEVALVVVVVISLVALAVVSVTSCLVSVLCRLREETEPRSTLVEDCLVLARVDFAPTHRQPSALRVLFTTVASIDGSLAGALLVALGTSVFSSTKGYVHFWFSDYAKLTVIGVIMACVARPIVTRISSSPKWLFLRLAILVTPVLLLPDLWLLARVQPITAVAVLMTMHLAIALITYNLLVHQAAIRADRGAPTRPIHARST